MLELVAMTSPTAAARAVDGHCPSASERQTSNFPERFLVAERVSGTLGGAMSTQSVHGSSLDPHSLWWTSRAPLIFRGAACVSKTDSAAAAAIALAAGASKGM